MRVFWLGSYSRSDATEASHPITFNYSKDGNNAVLTESLQFVILELQQL